MSNKITLIKSKTGRSTNTDDSIASYKKCIGCLKVLIVDDDKNSGESLRDIIKYRGHDVTLLDEGMKFVNRIGGSATSDTFDIIFMDYHTNEIDREFDESTGSVRSSSSESIGSVKSACSLSKLSSSSNSISSSNRKICIADSDSEDNIEVTQQHTDYEESDEITGTYITRLAHDCFDIQIPMFGYTGDNSNRAIQDFKDSKFKGVFIKPVSASLINSFFEIIEAEKRNQKSDSTDIFSRTTTMALRKLSMKNKNIVIFRDSDEKKVK